MCSVFQVSRSGYYAWSKRPESNSEQGEPAAYPGDCGNPPGKNGIYGSPKIHGNCKRRGKRHGKNRIARLMRKDGLYSKTKRKFRVTTDSEP